MPEIETARLCLRPFTLEDAGALHRCIYADAEVMRYLPGGEPQPLEKAQSAIETFLSSWATHGWGGLGIYRRGADDALCGECGLMFIPGTEEVEVFYALGRAYWGKGYATEAAGAVLRYGFETAGLDAISAVADPPNRASSHVMEKLGMTYCGITDRYYDNAELVHYVIERHEFSPGEGHYRLIETKR
jgi:ribosomal-protein-alanine N-acetyltransferase